MSLLNDPRDEYFEHFGVKGMKWGVRKEKLRLKIQKGSLNRSDKLVKMEQEEAGHAREASKNHLSGNIQDKKRHLNTMDNSVDELRWNGKNKEADAVEKSANALRRGKKDPTDKVEVSKALSEYAKIQDEYASVAKRLSSKNKADIKRTKAKIDKLESELNKPLTTKQKKSRETAIKAGGFLVGSYVASKAISMPSFDDPRYFKTKGSSSSGLVEDFFAKTKT